MTAASGNVKWETAPEASCKGAHAFHLSLCVCVCEKTELKSACVYKACVSA